MTDPNAKSAPRARLIRARTMVSNVSLDVGSTTDLRIRLRSIIGQLDDVLTDMRYLPDMPALAKEERP